MRQGLAWLVSFTVAVVVLTCHDSGNVWATPAAHFKSKTLYMGRVDAGEDAAQIRKHNPNDNSKKRLTAQSVPGTSDLYVQSNIWQVGGSTGWHTHPGHSLILVTAGAVTDYDGDDPDCNPHVYTKGMTFIDPGGGHVHIIRNEGRSIAQTIAIQLIPAGAARRIDVADPGNCHF